VQLVHSHRRLIVRGERPVAGNRWNRFRLEFKLPDDCDANGIQARFEKGVVCVTMLGAGMTPDATTAQQEPAAKQLAEPAAGAFGGVQGGDRAAPAPAPAVGAEAVEKDQEKTKAQKQESGRQRVSSFRGDDASTEEGDATPMAAAVPSSRQGHAFLSGRKKMATTVLGVLLALISLGIYVRYSFAP
jgi:hypothetical protein